MLDNMKFMPDTLQVNEGETIRFVVRNKGKLTHEMVIGKSTDIAAHAKEMQEMAATGHASLGRRATRPLRSRARALTVEEGEAWRHDLHERRHDQHVGDEPEMVPAEIAGRVNPAEGLRQPVEVGADELSGMDALGVDLRIGGRLRAFEPDLDAPGTIAAIRQFLAAIE